MLTPLISLLALTGWTTAKTSKVEVGKDGLSFSPHSTMVSPGDKVEFHFYPRNHSVVQGMYDNPCQPVMKDGFNSGYVPTMNGESSTTFTLTVNDTTPIWYHCGQMDHCKSGMVGVINPPKNGKSFQKYKKAASNASPSAAPNVVMGGVLGMSKEEGGDSGNDNGKEGGEEGMGMSSTKTGGMTMSTSSSSASGSTPSSTSAAERVGISTDLGLMSLLGGVVTMFLV